MKAHITKQVVFVCFAFAVLYLAGGYVIYNFAYTLCFLFLSYRILSSYASILRKGIQLFANAVILVLQILYNTFIMCPLTGDGAIYFLFRFLGVLLVLAPFAVGCIFFTKAWGADRHGKKYTDGQKKQ